MRIGFVLMGIVFGLVAGMLNELKRRQRASVVANFRAHGVETSARVQAIWERGREGRRREVRVRYFDGRGQSHDAETVMGAAEAGAIGLRVGGAVEISYLPDDPGEVLVHRPQVLDDRFWMPIVVGTLVCAICLALGALAH